MLAGARHPAAAHALQTAGREATPGTIDILTLDVRSDECARGAAEEAAAKVRSLDALVNNAGVFPEEGSEPLEKLPLECFEEAFSVNVVGVARVTRTFLPLLTKAPHPRVINISSLAGSVSQKEDARHYCYGASKAALNMLTRAVAAEFSPRGITVVAVTPGWVKTELGGPAGAVDRGGIRAESRGHDRAGFAAGCRAIPRSQRVEGRSRLVISSGAGGHISAFWAVP